MENQLINNLDHQGEWFNGKTAAFKVADLSQLIYEYSHFVIHYQLFIGKCMVNKVQ